MFAPIALRMLSMPAERSNLSQRASNLRVNHAAALNTIRSETRKIASTNRKGEAGDNTALICNTVVRANQCLCVVARARLTGPGCIRIRKLPMGKRMHNTRVPSVLCLSICGTKVVDLTQAALLLQSQMKL